MAFPNLSEIVTTTLRNRSGKLANNVEKNNALLKRLSQRGKIKKVSGGRTIVQELDYQENSTYKRYLGYEQLDISASDVFSAAEYDWRQAAVAVSMSGLEQIQNQGEAAIIDLLDSRITNAERTMRNNISIDCYSDGTADGSKQIGGLQLLVPDDPTTGTAGGINRANFTFWRSQRYRGVTDGGAPVSSANIQRYMNQLYFRTMRGADQVDLILADNTYYGFYLESLQAIQRIQNDKPEATAGFPSLKFMNADVVLDGAFGGGAPASHMYFLNTEYIFFRPASDRNFVPLDPDRFAVNQDAMVKLIGWAGNMTVSNMFLQGALIA